MIEHLHHRTSSLPLLAFYQKQPNPCHQPSCHGKHDWIHVNIALPNPEESSNIQELKTGYPEEMKYR